MTKSDQSRWHPLMNNRRDPLHCVIMDIIWHATTCGNCFFFYWQSICAYNVRPEPVCHGLRASAPTPRLPTTGLYDSVPPWPLFWLFRGSGVEGAGAYRSKPTGTWNPARLPQRFLFTASPLLVRAGHFLPVLLIGLLLYGLDQCHLRLYNQGTMHGFDGVSENL